MDDPSERYILRSARTVGAQYVRACVREGDRVVDATMGNGHDTEFLCHLVGETGLVYAFDVQKQAIENTRVRLEADGLLPRAQLLHAGHEEMKRYVKGYVQAVLFNLGWLPGGDHVQTTRTETTLSALGQALSLLHPGGIVTLCIYPGHAEGRRELEALLKHCAALSVQAYNVLHHRFLNASADAPQLLLIQKNT